MKQLIILAGGKGTRLKERLGNLPKPLIDIAGKPLLERQLLQAKLYGFNEVFITVCHQAETIREFCGDGSRFGLKIHCIEEEQPLGTAGAILAKLERFAETFVIMYGDTMLNVDLQRFWDFHHAQNAEVSLFLHPNDHPQDSDLVEIDADNRILAFHPYPHPEGHYYANLVNAALYVANKKAFTPWQTLVREGGIDFAKHLFPKMLEKQQLLKGYNSIEYIKDAGTPKRVDQVCADLESGKIQRRSLSQPKAAIFIDRDGTLTAQTTDVTSPDELQLLPRVASSLRHINQSGQLAILITNQPALAKGKCSESDLKAIHNKLEYLLGQEGAFLDALFYCPHHPEKGFEGERPDLKIPCDCRKPGTGMLAQAQAFAPIDLSASWFIGDSTVDMQTAKNAGLKSILVRTGFSGCDDKYAVRPDFECYNFAEATDFILNKYPGLLDKARALTAEIKPGQRLVVGGLARGGKSTWSSLMKIALQERQVPVVLISLDGWLKAADQRPKGGDVLSRHDLEALLPLFNQLKQLKTPLELALPSYNRNQRSPNQKREILSLTPQHVLIFEGVLAFLLEDLMQAADYHFFVRSSDRFRRQNFQKEYSLRGLPMEEIRALYQERDADENQLINSGMEKHLATLIEETL